jgi:hypothetical protein
LSSSPSTRWLRELAPLWWVLRAVVAVALLESLNDESVFSGPGPGGYAWLVALALIVAVIVSVAVGLRRPRRNAGVVLVNLMLALALVPVMASAIRVANDAAFNDRVVTGAPTGVAPAGLAYDGAPVENIYAFDRQGRLLQDVRLFMQDGRPLDIGAAPDDPNRRTLQTRAGKPAFNAFPIRYYEPGTKRVARPSAGVPARPGPVRTRPLR